jgi:hypothetical protein
MKGPPKPKAILRIGVTGHRPGAKLAADDGAILKQVTEILEIICVQTHAVAARHVWAFANDIPLVSVISSLAEGADRIVASAGLTLNLPLRGILPFHRDEYQKDFAADRSKHEFSALLARADAVLELDGQRSAEARAYEAAGLTMLANSDILIGIWDRRPPEGLGGTALIVERAISEGVPVILVDPTAKAEASILWMGDNPFPTTNVRVEDLPRRPIAELLPQLIEVLVAPAQGKAIRKLEEFYVEQERAWNYLPFYPALLACLGIRAMRGSDFRQRPYLSKSSEEWRSYFARQPNVPGLGTFISRTLLEAFAFADNLAVHYASNYRSAYVFNYLAAVLAVVLALANIFLRGTADQTAQFVFECLEMVTIVSILIVFSYGRTKRWHQRWLEYRRLAEWLRHFRTLAFTASRANIRRPNQITSEEQDWVSWYAFAIHREMPIANVLVEPGYLSKVRDIIRDPELRSQIDYNAANARLMSHTAKSLRTIARVLFSVTLAGCAAFLVMGIFEIPVPLTSIFVTALLPTIGAALNAIRVQGDFETVARRCEAARRRLVELDRTISEESLQFARLSDRIEKAADLMTADVSEWQILFSTRPLSLPA